MTPLQAVAGRAAIAIAQNSAQIAPKRIRMIRFPMRATPKRNLRIIKFPDRVEQNAVIRVADMLATILKRL